MRALLLVLDSVGCGSAPDSTAYRDAGANTLGHIFAALPDLSLPALFSLGLWKILTADVFDARSRGTIASFGRMRERSAGKDSTTGHWEIAGAILDKPFATFTAFPPELIEAIQRDAKVEFIGNYSQSGTVILEENPCTVRLSNSWIIMNPGGPPTPDKPEISVVDYQPGNTTSIFLNLRVADIWACYEEWKAKGAEFVTPPIDREAEIRCYMRDPDGYLIEVGQSTGLLHGTRAAKRPEDLPG